MDIFKMLNICHKMFIFKKNDYLISFYHTCKFSVENGL